VGYISSINELNSEIYNPLMQMEVGNSGGYGRALSIHLQSDGT